MLMPSFLLVVPLLAGPVDEGGTESLKYKTYRDWDIELPAETFTPVNGKIAIPHAGGDGFLVRPEGTGLAVDTDGDGVTDVNVSGREVEGVGRVGLVTLTGKASDGQDLVWSARLLADAPGVSGWHYAASGAVTGKVAGVKVAIIDQNNNGVYGEVGRDAMIVGRSSIAYTPLLF